MSEEKPPVYSRDAGGENSRRVLALLAGSLAISFLAARGGAVESALPTTMPAVATTQPVDGQAPVASLEQTRLVMSKWIETQQIISRERKEWEQGKDILAGRLELVQKESATVEESIKKAQAGVEENQKKRDDLTAENDQLKKVAAQLTAGITAMEGEIRKLYKTLPEPVQEKVKPLFQRIPEDAGNTKISVAERFQNVLGILKIVNGANNEITVNYETRELADGKRVEVKAIYIGLAQAYYVSASGDAGIGRPTPEGWKWEPSNAIARDVLTTLEILQGKQSAAFVPLPVKIQ